MNDDGYEQLPRRERQIMDVVYRQGRATVADVVAGIPNPPSYSAVRAMMGRLESKGYLGHSSEGGRYVYAPTRARKSAEVPALERLMGIFFDESPINMVAALLDLKRDKLSDRELREMVELIERARKEGDCDE